MRSEGSSIGSIQPIRATRRCSKPNPGVNSPGSSATSLTTPILHTLTITVDDVTRIYKIQKKKVGCNEKSSSQVADPAGVGDPEVLWGYADTKRCAQVTPTGELGVE